MKRIISIIVIFILAMTIFSGCKASSAAPQGAKGSEVLSQLNAMKEQGNKPKEMFDYLNQSIKELDKDSASEAVGILVSTLEEYEATYNEELFSGYNPDLMFKYFEFTFDYEKIALIKEEELKNLLYDITLGGFKILDAEGSFMVIVDYEALKTFDEYINEEIKSYIDIMASRYNDSAAVGQGMMLTLDELENRIIQMEQYILSYDGNQRKEVMTSMYYGYIMVYMSGTDNFPVFDFDTGNMSPEMFKEFETAASRHKDTVFGRVLNQYVALLKQEGFTNTETVHDFILHIDTAVDEQLKNYKK